MSNPFSVLLGEAPATPGEWPRDRARRVSFWTPADAKPEGGHAFDRDWSCLRKPVTQRDPAAPPKPESVRIREQRERKAAKAGEVFLPLEPGQKRRRRAGPDGKPLKRTKPGGYLREPVAPPPAPTPRRPPAPPAPMTYAQAMALRDRKRAGQPVSAEDLAEAERVVKERRAAWKLEDYST